MRLQHICVIVVCTLILCISSVVRASRSAQEPFQQRDVDFYTTLNGSIEVLTYRDILPYLKKQVQTHLHTQWSSQPYDEAHISTVWAKPHVFLVLVENNNLVGTMGITLSNRPYISNLYIVESYRRKGLASTLLAHVERTLKDHGYTVSTLACYEELLQYYAQKNYTIDQTYRLQNGVINYVMIKHL